MERENDIKTSWLLGESCLHTLPILKLIDDVSGTIEDFIAKILFKIVTFY